MNGLRILFAIGATVATVLAAYFILRFAFQ
jgi:hypothetical protein